MHIGIKQGIKTTPVRLLCCSCFDIYFL